MEVIKMELNHLQKIQTEIMELFAKYNAPIDGLAISYIQPHFFKDVKKSQAVEFAAVTSPEGLTDIAEGEEREILKARPDTHSLIRKVASGLNFLQKHNQKALGLDVITIYKPDYYLEIYAFPKIDK